MSEIPNPPVMPAVGRESFFNIWIRALTRPYEQTYASLAASSAAKATTGYIWYFVASLIQFFLASLVQNAAVRQYMEQYGNGQFDQFNTGGVGSRLITAVCGAPIAAVISVIFFALIVALVQWIARMFGGRGTNDQMVYVMSAILSPYLIVSGLLSLLAGIPYVGLCFGLLAALAGFYILYLEVTAVKAVNQFGWGQALASFFAPVLGIACLCACVVGGLFALLAPMISNTFQQIQQGLGQ
jgi:hypothetical protein